LSAGSQSGEEPLPDTADSSVDDELGLTSFSRPDTKSKVSPARLRLGSLDDRERKIALQVEARVQQTVLGIIRQEKGDPYAGLPADDVLIRLDQAFPNVRFPERMMQRLELEQQARLESERRQDEIALADVENRRSLQESQFALRREVSRRAVVIFFALLALGTVLVFTGHEGVGATVLGTTMVSVIGAFLWQQTRESRGR
jgi:lipopolysaccharide export LptBFGC system permease protein LptF